VALEPDLFVALEIDELVQRLHSGRGTERKAARERLVEIGRPATGALLGALADEESQVRWEAAKALASLADGRASPGLVDALERVGRRAPVVFPLHPRTAAAFTRHGLLARVEAASGIASMPPLGYLEFLDLMSGARLVLTDSGGIQEETTTLEVPCLTLRPNTERPVTLTEGTNVLVGTDPDRILEEGRRILSGGGKPGRIPELWDGKSGERIADALEEIAEGDA